MIERVASPVSYDVGVKGTVVKRHSDQLRLRVDNTLYSPIDRKEQIREPSDSLGEPVNELLQVHLLTNVMKVQTITIEKMQLLVEL